MLLQGDNPEMTELDTPRPLPATATANPSAAKAITLGMIGAAVFYFLPEILLVGSEMWLAIWAAVWAVNGLFNLAPPYSYVTTALLILPGLWASYQLVRLALIGWQNKDSQLT